MSSCEVCHAECVPGARGRKPKFCSSRCRVIAHRRKSIPNELLILDRWIRHSQKRPMTVEGFWASSTNPVHWSPYEIAKKSTHGDGLGFVLNGDGIVCVDLDHCFDNGALNPVAKSIVELFPNAYVEVSPSGNGLHIWGRADLEAGHRFQWNGQNVEIYPDGRFMTMTGNIFRNGGLPNLDVTQLLSETQVV